MVYARAHDQTVAEDYFSAMERIEQRLEIVPVGQILGDVKVQVVQLIERLELPELCYEERLKIASQLRQVLNTPTAFVKFAKRASLREVHLH